MALFSSLTFFGQKRAADRDGAEGRCAAAAEAAAPDLEELLQRQPPLKVRSRRLCPVLLLSSLLLVGAVVGAVGDTSV